MTSDPLVSVILPLFNGEKYIEKTISSVTNQTHNNLELIVVDDCSEDNSISIVQNMMKNDARIRLVELEENFGGPAKPRNVGMQASKGDYIAFLDHDDIWRPEKLEVQISAFSNDKTTDIVHSLAHTIDSDGNQIGRFQNQKVHRFLRYIFDDLTILFFSNYININSAIIRNDADIMFRENAHFIALEDWVFWIDNKFKSKKVLLVERELIDYREVLDSASQRGSDKSFRKIFYMYSTYLNESKISIWFFLLLTAKNIINLLWTRAFFRLKQMARS